MADLTRKTANLFDETYPNIDSSLHYLAINVGNGDFTLSTTCPRNQSGACLFFLAGNVSSGASTENNGVWGYSGSTYGTMKRTQTAVNGYVTIAYRSLSTNLNPVNEDTILNAGLTPLPYEPYGWLHSLRKLTTATEAVENPLYSDGTAITSYTIKGNTVQNGTPTPSNPITISGVGNKTANLLPPPTAAASGEINGVTYSIDKYGICTFSGTATADIDISYNLKSDFTIPISVGAGGHGVVAFNNSISTSLIANFMYNQTQIDNWNMIATNRTHSAYTSMGNKTINRIKFTATSGSNLDGLTVAIAFSDNDTAVSPFVPSGYEIPISSNGAALTPMYFSQQLYKIGNTTDSVISSGTATYETTETIFDGSSSEAWSQDGTSGTNSRYRIALDSAYNNTTDVITTHYVTEIGWGENRARLYKSGTTVFLYISVPTSTYPTVSDFKAFLADQYAAGTPLKAYYVKATPTTETVTAPTIPTTDGANSITVDTTVQPSEFTATWTGWHDSSVKEWDGTDWQ